MTLYDANDIKTLVNNYWSLTNPALMMQGLTDGEAAVNGGFELGNTSGWTGTDLSIVTAITGYIHTGTYACKIGYHGDPCNPTYGQLIQTWAIPIQVNYISSMSVWVRAIDGLQGSVGYITVTYSDLTTTVIHPTTQFQQWLYVNILSSLVAGKSVKSITMGKTAPYGFDYVDDFDLTVTNGYLYLQLDEYNPINPDYQIVFINSPERVMFVSPNVIKHEINVTLQVYTKLPHYQNDDIETTYRPRLLAMKNELTRIMNANRFDSLALGVTINHSAWVDAKLPHGYGNEAEPISFLSTMSVQIHWYEALDNTEIGIRVQSVQIMGGDLLGVMGCEWKDTDPWVMLQVPKGPLLEQHLLGPHVDGSLTCHDFQSIYTQLHTIPVSVGGTQYPINIDDSKTKFSTNPVISQFSVFMEDMDGNVQEFQFVNVRIRTVELTRATTTGMTPITWTIRFMADYIYPVGSGS